MDGFVSGGQAVLLHVDDGPVSMQVGALYAERLGYLLGRHVNRNVDRKVNLTLLPLRVLSYFNPISPCAFFFFFNRVTCRDEIEVRRAMPFRYPKDINFNLRPAE